MQPEQRHLREPEAAADPASPRRDMLQPVAAQENNAVTETALIVRSPGFSLARHLNFETPPPRRAAVGFDNASATSHPSLAEEEDPDHDPPSPGDDSPPSPVDSVDDSSDPNRLDPLLIKAIRQLRNSDEPIQNNVPHDDGNQACTCRTCLVVAFAKVISGEEDSDDDGESEGEEDSDDDGESIDDDENVPNWTNAQDDLEREEDIEGAELSLRRLVRHRHLGAPAAVVGANALAQLIIEYTRENRLTSSRLHELIYKGIKPLFPREWTGAIPCKKKPPPLKKVRLVLRMLAWHRSHPGAVVNLADVNTFYDDFKSAQEDDIRRLALGREKNSQAVLFDMFADQLYCEPCDGCNVSLGYFDLACKQCKKKHSTRISHGFSDLRIVSKYLCRELQLEEAYAEDLLLCLLPLFRIQKRIVDASDHDRTMRRLLLDEFDRFDWPTMVPSDPSHAARVADVIKGCETILDRGDKLVVIGDDIVMILWYVLWHFVKIELLSFAHWPALNT